MTFDRAVSLDDYQAIAAGAPGVVQAIADFVYDPIAQRPRVTLWVAGDQGAVAAVETAFAGAADPNRPVDVIAAIAVTAAISLTYVRDPRYDDAAVRANLTTVLVDPDSGLLGANVVGIGQVFYDSQIYAKCRSVAGIVAIHNLTFTPADGLLPRGSVARLVSHARFVPQPAACTGQRHDPGPGKYFVIPNDPQHLRLNGAVAS
jgi:hypothetical protein